MTTGDTNLILDELAAERARIESAEQQKQESMARRDALIRAGRRDGYSKRALAAVAGVKHQRVTQIAPMADRSERS